MASNTYVALQTTTLGANASSVTFSSIPQGYTDLYLVIQAKNLTGNSDVQMRFNSDSGTNYSATILGGDGSSAYSSRRTNSTSVILNYFDFLNSTTATQFNVNIQNYSNATTNKTAILRASRADQATEAVVGMWRSTAAITQIDLTPSSSQFASGTTFTLYGVAAASVGAKATGGTIYQDASYFYHVFSGNGTFTPTQSISADVLVVAGGASGASGVGGGGGAGGLLYYSSQSLTATGYTCTVGAGGAGQSTSNSKGNNGVNSSFGALTAAVGGGGGGNYIAGPSGNTGGSGGGAQPSSNGTTSGSAGTSGQGNAGGSGSTDGSTYRSSGGGGGAGVIGSNGSTSAPQIGGAGGNGLSTYSSWGIATGIGESISGTYYYAGGGGGGNGTPGVGGYGGGTAGTASGATANALANTGGGSGGGATSGNGGSGVIIVRYAK